ncbi:MAG TPA: hypothetical protein VJZ70_02330 [Limnochordia bacterium]|jgi:hypothetical protein|nr:hypothetical protein [Bacillota bacterium]HKM42805.1 hypothetical protein [Limnochordia bacterium]
MKKWSLVLALLLVIGLSNAGMAAEGASSGKVDFIVNVAPTAKFTLQDTAVLNIDDGTATGKVVVNGTIETNFPWKAQISTTRVAENDGGETNNWFWYECFIGGTRMFGGNPGAGATYKRKQGVNDVQIELSVRPHKDKAWYELSAGEYKTSLVITVAAQ